MEFIKSIILFPLVFAAVTGYAQAQFTLSVPTDFIEDGKNISLEMVVFKPAGTTDGPFPTLVFNHGSAGIFDSPDDFLETDIHVPIARFFNSKGWLVVFPQRRGRGRSEGIYDEGLTKNRARYSIAPKRSLPGLESAMEDIDAVVEYLHTNSIVDTDQMLIGGQSRGGLLSIVYAGTRPNVFSGSINFSGGWIGNFSGSGFVRFFYDYMEKINTVSFVRGAGTNKPTIWLYGENDNRYSLAHSKTNFDAFISAGGIGSFHSYPVSGAEGDGHFISFYPALWRHDLEEFINKLE